MKKLIVWALIFSLTLSVSGCGKTPVERTISEIQEQISKDAYAVVTDGEGNIIEHLEVEVSVTQVSGSHKDTGTTYTLTCTTEAPDSIENVTVAAVLKWNDIQNITNSLVSVSGNWEVGENVVAERVVEYGSRDIQNKPVAPFTKNPTDDNFTYSPSNCTGYLFYLSITVKFDRVDKYIHLYVQTVDIT